MPPVLLEHVGWAVADADAARATIQKLLGLAAYKTETVAREGVRTHFLDAGARLELLEALGPDSPVGKFLDKRGEGLHHLAFAVADVDAAFARLEAAGVPLLADAPKPGADGKRIFFVHPRATHGVLVEFCGDDDRLPDPTWVPFDGIRLALYRFPAAEADAGGRPPFLVLHGAGGTTATETHALARLLQPDFSVAALDFEGHGASGDTGAPITFDRCADAALAALDALGWDAAHVAGYSFGGAVALRLAHRHPDRVRRLAVHATNLDWDERLVRAMQRRLNVDTLARAAPAALARLDAAHGGRARTLFPRVAAFTATIPAFRPEIEGLRTLAAPVLVTAGDRDELFPLDRTLALHAVLPNAALGVLPGVRHTLTPDAARTLAPPVAAFLRAGS